MTPEEQSKQIQEWYNSGKSVYLLDEDGNAFGTADFTRWNNAKWYQRILGKISNRYKHRFIDAKGFTLKTK